MTSARMTKRTARAPTTIAIIKVMETFFFSFFFELPPLDVGLEVASELKVSVSVAETSVAEDPSHPVTAFPLMVGRVIEVVME